MERAITVSCNAYFAQLGVFSVGAKALSDTAKMLEQRFDGKETYRHRCCSEVFDPWKTVFLILYANTPPNVGQLTHVSEF